MTAKYVVVDGERRWRAATLAGIKSLACIVLPKRPSKAELRIIQASIDRHRSGLKPSEEAALLVEIRQESGLTLTETCKKVGYSQAKGSKQVTMQEKAAPGIWQLVDSDQLSFEKAYSIVASTPDHAKQLELAKSADKLPREVVRKRANGHQQVDEVKLTSATFSMPGGYTVAMRGGSLDLANAVEVLTETVRILKKSLQQGLSISSVVKMTKDTAKAK